MGVLKVKTTSGWQNISTSGGVGPAGPPGAQGIPGPQGPQGETGVSSIIVGDFGNITTPADLPPDGLLPVDWDGPGNPAVAFQMEQGWSLYYDKPTDLTLDGHLFQYVGTGIDPSGWLDIGLIQGPPGPAGPAGPVGPERDEVFVGPDDPLIIDPAAVTDIWVDEDAPNPPPVGLEDTVVLKANVLGHTFLGPWVETNANSVWTVDVPPGSYMAVLSVASLSTGTGGRGVNLWIDGVKTNLQSYLWFNTAGVHHMMNTDIEILTLGGTHTFWVKDNGSCAGDSNDRGALYFIPCGTP